MAFQESPRGSCLFADVCAAHVAQNTCMQQAYDVEMCVAVIAGRRVLHNVWGRCTHSSNHAVSIKTRNFICC